VSRNEQVRPWRIGKREVRAMFISVVIIGILGMFAAFLTFVPTSDPNIIVFYILFFILLALAAATPQFFGAVFGPWAGLFAGGVGSLVGLIVFANIGELHYNGTLIPIDQYASAYSSIWPLHLGIALVGFMSGFAAFKRKGRYNIGRTLGFSFLGVLAGTVFAALMTLITQRYSPGSLNSFLLGLGIVALIYIVAGLILLPISLVIYTRIVERRKRR